LQLQNQILLLNGGLHAKHPLILLACYVVITA
jgi:hypothetical protein